MRYEKFRVKDLFGSSKLGKYHNIDTLKEDDNGYPYICASNLNNGINKTKPFVNGRNLSLTPKNIIAWGKQCPMFTYHKEQCVTSQGMYYIELNDLSEESALYLCAVFTHVCKDKYSYSNCLIGTKMDNKIISLPTLTNPDNTPVIDPEHKYHPEGYIPDWEYMQDYIKELEQDYIKELEQYLIVTGLNDYELTDEDREVLEKINERLKGFRVGDLFEIHPTNAYKMNNEELKKVKGNNIILSNSSVNNGVGGYCGRDNTEKGNIITFSDTTTGSDTMFYQSKDFIGYPHVQGMYPYDKEHWKEKQCLYFISAMHKAAGTGWSYSTKFTRKLVAEMKPLIPIKLSPNNSPVIDPTHQYHPEGYVPDWEYMEKYIRAIEKLVIKDVVKYKDEMIKKTKEVI